MKIAFFSLQLGFLFAVEFAHAQPAQPTLEWNAEEGCINRETLVRGVEATLGVELFTTDGSEAAITARGEILRVSNPSEISEFRANVFVSVRCPPWCGLGPWARSRDRLWHRHCLREPLDMAGGGEVGDVIAVGIGFYGALAPDILLGIELRAS